ncbi:MAG: peptide deformylase [Parachlamydiales bacterium]|nr:peptide deformylase [Parachlamydiales bacterium]
MIYSLVYYGNPLLRKKCHKIEKITDEIIDFARDLVQTMDASNGVGLAANQVGKLVKMFAVRPLVQDNEGNTALGPAEVYINPVLSHPSEETEMLSEGCLSFPGLHYFIERPKSIHIEALDLDGKTVSKTVEGFYAREIMHENDHLNGVLFIDRLDKKTRKEIERELRMIKNKYRS